MRVQRERTVVQRVVIDLGGPELRHWNIQPLPDQVITGAVLPRTIRHWHDGVEPVVPAIELDEDQIRSLFAGL
ncbi:MAG: hypothetical protein N3C12_11950 [Candidatus Binatia bacterium]|nr:hypothetical protein [Candidatus Binatia bacterium]